MKHCAQKFFSENIFSLHSLLQSSYNLQEDSAIHSFSSLIFIFQGHPGVAGLCPVPGISFAMGFAMDMAGMSPWAPQLSRAPAPPSPTLPAPCWRSLCLAAFLYSLNISFTSIFRYIAGFKTASNRFSKSAIIRPRNLIYCLP